MSQGINQLKSWLQGNLAIVFELGIGIVIILIIFQFFIRFLPTYVHDPKLRLQIRKGILAVEIFVILIFIGLVFSDSFRHLIFSLSALSAVGTLGLKELPSSISGWALITFGKIYKHGDRIQVGETVGDVIKIGLTRTTLMECGEWLEGDSYTGRLVHFNNSKVIEEFIFNYSDHFPFIWDAVWVQLDYSSDRALAQTLIQDAIHKAGSDQLEIARSQWSSFPHQSSLENVSFEPKIQLSGNKDYMKFKVTYVVDYRQRGLIKNRFFHSLLEEFEQYPDQIKFPLDTLKLLSNSSI